MKKVLLLLCVGLLVQSITLAQQSDSANAEAENPDSTEFNFWNEHNVNAAAVPMVSYDPALGWNFAALANVFFRVTPSDTISPLSMAGAMVGYTTNKTWYWALYTKLYLD